MAPYRAAVGSAANTFHRLQTLTADNPAQQQRLKNLQPIMIAKLNELRTTVALAQRGNCNEALTIVDSNRGMRLMQDVRNRLTAISEAEFDLLKLREDASSKLRAWLLSFITICLVAATVLALFLANSLRYYIARLEERTAQLQAEAKHRHSAEETLRQVQKLEAVGQLTGGIAHDFNNLLTIIIGNLDSMRRRLAETAPEQSASQLAGILSKPLDAALQGSQSAAKLIHRLLAFSRRQTLEPTRLDANRLIADISDMLRRTLGEAVDVETVLAGGLWPTFADANQLENAVINLCINARDAMPEGGRLTIETANTYLDDEYAKRFGDVSPGQYVAICVSDTGTGISTEVMERVFEPFFTTKAAGEGSGLGLAMVHGFVKQSGGHIRIYSEVGHGSTVKIYLPRLAQDHRNAAVPVAQSILTGQRPSGTPSETVLVVEDNDGVREYAKNALAELGYSVIEAADAREALQLAKGGARFDVLFTDVVLPGGMNGRELALEIAKLRPSAVVLYTTGYTRNAIVHSGRLDANVHLLGKPYTQQSLARKLRELLDGSTAGKM